MLFATPLGGCLARPNSVTNVIGIPIAEGANPVPRLVPDGRSGLIVEGSLRSAGRPDAILVMLPRLAPARGWDVVGVEDASTGQLAATLPAIPGERQDARFARAKVGGMPATLLFVAHGNGSAGNPAPFTIDTYTLSTDGDDASGLPAVFHPLDRTTTRVGYCSADAALVDVERLLPEPGTATGRRDGQDAAPPSQPSRPGRAPTVAARPRADRRGLAARRPRGSRRSPHLAVGGAAAT